MTDKPMSDFERACAAFWDGYWPRASPAWSDAGMTNDGRAAVRRGMVAAFREIRDVIPPGSALTRDGIDELIRQGEQE